MNRSGFLGLHVLGANFGECIILQFPFSPPAVIDCGALEVARFAIQFIRRELKWSELSFIAVTHPHRDHIHGIGMFLEDFKEKSGSFLVFPGFHMGKLMYDILTWATEQGHMAEQDQNFLNYPVMREWGNIAELLRKYKRKTRVTRQWIRPLEFAGQVKMHCILPCDVTSDGFETALARSNPREQGAIPNANCASCVLLVTWGDTRVLLCGDCEQTSWGAWKRSGGTIDGVVHGLKIGHHGSQNGVDQEVLKCLGKVSRGIVTPFRLGRVQLPDETAIQRYASLGVPVHITAGEHSVSTMRRLTGQLAALCEALRPHTDEMASTLLSLHPQPDLHRNQVSLLFDDKGKLVDKRLGSGVRVIERP
jgi:hypothetical protein